MANVESITLDQGQQQAAARQLAMDNIRRQQQRAQQKYAARKQNQAQRGLSQIDSSPLNAAQLAANQAYRRGWQYGQEAVEDLAFSFIDFTLISGLAMLLIYSIRLVVGNFFGGGPQIKFREFSMPLVPGYTIVEGIYRTAKALIIALITGVIYSALLIAGYIATHPWDVIKGIFTETVCWLFKFFGGTCI